MALDGEHQIGLAHALAVVGDADEAAAAAVGEHVDAARAGIERVLDQFLDHARRTLDHLAGGDAVDDGFRKLADGHGQLGCSTDNPDSLRSRGLSAISPDLHRAINRTPAWRGASA